MKVLSALMVFILSASALFAKTSVENIDYQKWDKLVAYTRDYGQDTQIPRGYMKTISYEAPAADTSHRREFFSLVGLYTRSGKFLIRNVSMVSENWQMTSDGNWEIDQWIFTAGKKGKLHEVRRNHLLEDPHGAILEYHSVPVGKPGSAEIQKVWEKKTTQWFGQYL